MTGIRRQTAAAAAALAILAASCAGGRTTLGTGASVCFRALPPAKAAVHDKGRLVGVRRVSAATLKKRIPNDRTLATLPDQQLCVVAFDGSFDAPQVTGAVGNAHGRYALVAVAIKRPDVVRAFVTNRLPTRFNHLH
ncbi:MAG: hypothetical protein M3N98_10580 [Actinomycetota bacterium]|nr:hypothetical protein [Actinomycetota bacterium]